MSFNVAKIAVSVATYLIDKPYSYLIPLDLQEKIEIGMRVLVPFGMGNKKIEGLVLSVEKAENTKGFKYINMLLDQKPIVDKDAIKLAFFIKKRYFATFYEVIKTILPTGHFFDYEDRFYLNREKITDDIFENHEPLISKIEIKGFIKKDTINSSEIDFLVENEVLFKKIVSKNKVSNKKVTLYSINPNIFDPVSEVYKGVAKEIRKEVILYLLDEHKADFSELSTAVDCSKQIINTLVKQNFIIKEDVDVYRELEVDYTIRKSEIILSEEQKNVYLGLENKLLSEEFSKNLLYGVTGSGKTQIYISLIKKTLEMGKEAILLMPEIALTSHLLTKFTEFFGEEVAVLHSGLTPAERYDEWKKINEGKCKIAIGTRSSIFAPFKNLGIIIIDEEHEHTYKSEQNPRYNAIEVANFIAFHQNATLLLSSATPQIESFYETQIGKTELFVLNERYGDATLPDVTIYDMKNMNISGRYSNIGDLLKDEIEINLKNGEQTILYLNRRGNSKQYQCLACGYVPECENCSQNMTFHSTNERLVCHLCGKSMKAPIICPKCDSRHIKTDIFGTQKIEIELSEMFPEAKILRLDADTTKKRGSHNEIIEKFRKGQADILIGTQMVTKGLDFENATLVGVIDADQALFSESFRSREEVFSKITQVIGRAGRKIKKGRAIIQTFNPDNEVIVLAKNQAYQKFYELEIDRRMLLNLPPISELFSFVISGKDEQKVIKAAIKTFSAINQLNLDLIPLGPTPAKILKINNNFRYIITIRLNNKEIKQKFISFVLKYFAKEHKNVNIYINLDGEC